MTAVILGLAAALLVGNTGLMVAHGGEDLGTYQINTAHWLGDGSYYPGYQLAGAYQIRNDASLYPPPFALFMLPWLVLPAFFWWAIPLAILVFVVIRFRPSAWTWPLIALCIAAPRTLSLTIYGNSTMWVAAAVAAALYWRIPTTVLIFIKPSLLPFALVGMNRRQWWLAAIPLGIISLAMLPMWADYLTSVRNVQGGDLSHSIGDVACVSIPVIAWVGRRPRPHVLPSPRRFEPDSTTSRELAQKPG